MESIDVFALQCHPAAEKFPMLDDDELAELANDISENGLRQPLVIYQNGAGPVLLDGRNRRAACALVKVTPEYVMYDGDDPAGFVLSSNINRRHMTKGQRAMAVALVCLETKQTMREAASKTGMTAGRIAQASTVIKHAPEFTDAVLNGSKTLDEAYAKAQENKLLAESTDQRFQKLKAAAPDLADQVVEGRLTLDEACAANDARANQLRAERIAISKNIADFSLFDSNTATDKHLAKIAAIFSDAPKLFQEATGFTPDDYIRALTVIRDRADKIIKLRGVRK